MRRMVNSKITDSDMFIEMPGSSRLLYYDLLTRADDDGFITPKRIMRMTGAMDNDLDVLIAKQFLYKWEDGVVIVLHWREHNHVKSDRYVPSDYFPRLRELGKLYTLGARQDGTKLEPKRILSGSISVPQDRVGKDRVGNNTNTDTNTKLTVADAPVGRIQFLEKLNPNTLYAWTVWEAEISEINTNLEGNRAALNHLLELNGNIESLEKLIKLAGKAWEDKYSAKEVRCSSPLELWKKRQALLAWGKGKFKQTEVVKAY